MQANMEGENLLHERSVVDGVEQMGALPLPVHQAEDALVGLFWAQSSVCRSGVIRRWSLSVMTERLRHGL